MARPIMDLEEELARIYSLVGELSEQLASNRALVTQLKGRGENVKGQAAHVGTGFPLRRFNLDISDEEFNSELEKFASHLILENQTLQHENKQLSGLLKEYETTLEDVMSKFRGVAHASQQHDLSLHSYYTSLLSTLQTAHSSTRLHDDTSLSLLLSRLSTLLRSTLRSMGGEEVDGELQSDLMDLVNGLESHPHLKQEHDSQQAEAGPGPSSSSQSASFGTGNGRTLSKPPRKPNPFPGSLPGSSGGYIGTEGQSDWAIEREMEILRLEEENASLRNLLSISEEIPVMEEPQPIPELGLGSPEHTSESRKGSLTIEELEFDAAREADEKQRSIIMSERLASADSDQLKLIDGIGAGAGAGDRDGAGGQVEMMTDTPGELGEIQDTGVVDSGGDHGGSGKRERPMITASMLGFEAGAPPEQAIVDEVETETEAEGQAGAEGSPLDASAAQADEATGQTADGS